MNIDELQLATAQTPADDDPWPIQLLELLDQNISNHFPRFDHPKWELPHPDLQSCNPEGREEEKYSTPDFGHHIPEDDKLLQPKEEAKSSPPIAPSVYENQVLEVPGIEFQESGNHFQYV